jgi:periplasmic protein TonB
MRARGHSIDRLSRSAGIAAAASLHLLAGALLLSYEPARTALLATAPIMVDWIAPPRPEPKPPEPPNVPPKPRPIAKPIPRPVEPPPLVTAVAQAPSPIVAPEPPAEPPPPPPEPAAAPVQAPVAVTPPVFSADYLDNPPPGYPLLSRRAGEQGRVLLRVLVNADGRADEVQVHTSSGHWRLDDSARKTVGGWRFVQARRCPLAVPAWVLIPISFRLDN